MLVHATGGEVATDMFGSGGGFSSMFTAPTWQKEAVEHFFQTAPKQGLPPDSVFAKGGRATPDVSALGEGYQVLMPGQCNMLPYPYPQAFYMGFKSEPIAMLRNTSSFGECCQACPDVKGCSFFQQIFDDGSGQQACAFFGSDAKPTNMTGVLAGVRPSKPYIDPSAGTSCAAPVFSSLVSMLNDARLAHGKSPMGFLNPWLYQNAHMFTDITNGSNRIDRSGSALKYGWDAVPGWDPVTGLGTPKFDAMLAAALRDVVVIV